MDINILRSFVTTAELGNMTRAAKQLHVSQPTLSRQIQSLEDELGIALFDRVGKFIRLSSSGESMLDPCRDILERAQKLKVSVHNLKSGKSGLLKVGASPQLLERLFPLFLPSFQEENPGVEVRLTEGDSTSLLKMLANGELHIVMSPTSIEGRFRTHKVGRLTVMAVGRPGRGRKRSKEIDIAEVCEHPMLTLRRGFKSRELFDAACRLKGLHPVIALESSAPHTLIALAEAGLGYAIVPSSTPIPGPSVKAFVLTIEGKRIEFDFAAAWDPNRPLPVFAQCFIRSLQEHKV
jgi:DNA-binding transcriptional LysR family regulator